MKNLLISQIPFLIIGVAYGLMLAKVKFEVLKELHENSLRFMDLAKDTMIMHADSMKLIDNMAEVCMRNDRFELVDVKREEDGKKDKN